MTDCPICDNGSGAVCDACRADPANDGWLEADENELGGADHLIGRVPSSVPMWLTSPKRARELTPMQAKLVLALARGCTLRAAAAEAGCSLALAQRVAERIRRLT